MGNCCSSNAADGNRDSDNNVNFGEIHSSPAKDDIGVFDNQYFQSLTRSSDTYREPVSLNKTPEREPMQVDSAATDVEPHSTTDIHAILSSEMDDVDDKRGNIELEEMREHALGNRAKDLNQSITMHRNVDKVNIFKNEYFVEPTVNKNALLFHRHHKRAPNPPAKSTHNNLSEIDSNTSASVTQYNAQQKDSYSNDLISETSDKFVNTSETVDEIKKDVSAGSNVRSKIEKFEKKASRRMPSRDFDTRSSSMDSGNLVSNGDSIQSTISSAAVPNISGVRQATKVPGRELKEGASEPIPKNGFTQPTAISKPLAIVVPPPATPNQPNITNNDMNSSSAARKRLEIHTPPTPDLIKS